MNIYTHISKNRRFFALLIFTFAISTLVGCTSEQSDINVSAAKIEDQMKQSVKLDKLKKGDSHKLKKLYDLGTEQVEDFILYTATSNVKADEIVVIKVKDEKQIDSVKASIAKRIDTQAVKFKDYRPDEYALLEKHVLKVKSHYILFAVSTDAEQIEQAFDAALK
ncbi:DUF4358 domain-containing protein [Paenibacillus apiarius]|uniref:DUF4358 domain-containing protein n=1 Tax=Paenibacillus apiarius TaxID=46240 RepID=A0ABT4DXQ3_9BACL|nr:DUF4358 domain-containing protein [Paenibacillus apiarius]MCY9517610.1 DUF4358 domain-containing protein [Paenibacillus apiarius]MCY9522130.1 DUF4358 domain-containing protein [Paenibacillus apiarius]MCY9552581.1 DUF4358 domain-containing protein [Paenibacillus apiarius]MCY9559230.1 DUF4358 domain-containing protein [Paenibacillus apiarius]MCY9683653.1 DUF4358 domain-containing protein [Paenibacillus apiarius]